MLAVSRIKGLVRKGLLTTSAAVTFDGFAVTLPAKATVKFYPASVTGFYFKILTLGINTANRMFQKKISLSQNAFGRFSNRIRDVRVVTSQRPLKVSFRNKIS